MTKLLLLTLFVIFLLGRTQKPAPTERGVSGGKTPASGVSFSTFGSAGAASCPITFYVGNTLVYTETMSPSRATANRRSFTAAAENKITRIDYQCNNYCWIILFANAAWAANSIGFWTYQFQDSIQLANYMSYNQASGTWDHWNSVASSYSIYCYF